VAGGNIEKVGVRRPPRAKGRVTGETRVVQASRKRAHNRGKTVFGVIRGGHSYGATASRRRSDKRENVSGNFQARARKASSIRNETFTAGEGN